MKLPDTRKETANVDRAAKNWGALLPDWVRMLASACDTANQKKVATRLGISGTMVNQVIGGVYQGNLANLETRVRGEMMAATLDCPVLGAISTRDCLDHHTRKFATTNPLRRMLANACQNCPHNTKRST